MIHFHGVDYGKITTQDRGLAVPRHNEDCAPVPHVYTAPPRTFKRRGGGRRAHYILEERGSARDGVRWVGSCERESARWVESCERESASCGRVDGL